QGEIGTHRHNGRPRRTTIPFATEKQCRCRLSLLCLRGTYRGDTCPFDFIKVKRQKQYSLKTRRMSQKALGNAGNRYLPIQIRALPTSMFTSGSARTRHVEIDIINSRSYPMGKFKERTTPIKRGEDVREFQTIAARHACPSG